MNMSSYASSLTSRVSVSPLTVPTLVWECYLEYLWFYEPSSWVARTAYGFRVLAFLLVFPITVLTLLDIASYVVARTLGVVDDVKASTSDKPSLQTVDSTPSIIIDDYSTSDPSLSSSATLVDLDTRHKDALKADTPEYTLSQPDSYFTSEENTLTLSGVGVFSPVASQPPSPTLTRRQLPSQGSWIVLEGEEGTLRKRAAGEVITE